MSPGLQLAIVLAVLAMAWAIRTRIRATAPGRYTATASQRRAWRRERLRIVRAGNRRRVS